METEAVTYVLTDSATHLWANMSCVGIWDQEVRDWPPGTSKVPWTATSAVSLYVTV